MRRTANVYPGHGGRKPPTQRQGLCDQDARAASSRRRLAELQQVPETELLLLLVVEKKKIKIQ
ncbi:uncharacterized protein V6R79_006920 [Siganus canaliculatus]